MDGVLNQNTKTVHKRRRGDSPHRTVCGHTVHVDGDRLSMTTVDEAVSDLAAEKCGGCFEDAGGY
jgi:hypothetical protein